MIQRVIRSQMGKLGVRFEIVNNGQEALAAMETGNYGLVLMDCQMPVMDGLQATAARRRAEKGQGLAHMPVVAMTANALEGDELRCLEAGMDDYLSKPVKLEMLEKVLDRWIPAARPASMAEPATHEALPVFSDTDVKKSMGDGYREDGVFAELVQIFGEDTPARLARLEAALGSFDAAGIRAEAHAIKGSCRALGALRMGGSCEALEAMGAGEKLEGAGAVLASLKEEFQFTLAELANAAGPQAAVA